MCNHLFSPSLLVSLLVYADFTYSQVYYIKPSLDSPCSQGISCLTISQLAANSTNYYGNETGISLYFLPGNHTLDTELSLAHSDNFTMATYARNDETVYIKLMSQADSWKV